jgi:hypothetical protein
MLVYVLHKEKHVTFAVNKIILQQFVVRNSNECVTISQKNGKNKGQDFSNQKKKTWRRSVNQVEVRDQEQVTSSDDEYVFTTSGAKHNELEIHPTVMVTIGKDNVDFIVDTGDFRVRDETAKNERKLYADRQRRSKSSNIEEGNAVLVRNKKRGKLQTPFQPTPYEVIKKRFDDNCPKRSTSSNKEFISFQKGQCGNEIGIWSTRLS